MLASIVWGTWLIKKHALLLKDPIALQEALAVEEHLALRDIFALECLQTRFNVRLKPCQATIVLEALLFLYHALQATIALAVLQIRLLAQQSQGSTVPLVQEHQLE